MTATCGDTAENAASSKETEIASLDVMRQSYALIDYATITKVNIHSNMGSCSHYSSFTYVIAIDISSWRNLPTDSEALSPTIVIDFLLNSIHLNITYRYHDRNVLIGVQLANVFKCYNGNTIQIIYCLVVPICCK